MPLLLGLDTGGTYTDAVLFEEGAAQPVRHTAKSLTTHGNLAHGIAAAIDAILPQTAPNEIALTSLSTTLATNALVEGQGGRTALIFIGFSEADATRGGLTEALNGDPCVHITGGHTTSGQPQAPLDVAALRAAAKTHAETAQSFAIVAAFASRNPAHEVEARAIIRTETGLPTTCGHELSAKLGGPKRAVTAVLNARLIGLIADLIDATEATLTARQINAPLMLVRGDGALISAAFARQRPIETILSGPAASLVGAATLTGCQDAVVADIGGTTTDIAILHEGRPRLSTTGARIGPHTTMVDAVEMTAVGLGGDSRVRLSPTLETELTLGPDRALPLSLLAIQHPETIAVLQTQLAKPIPQELDGQFAVEGGRVQPLATLLKNRKDRADLARKVAQGTTRIAALTPSDAAHILGLQSGWNTEAATLGATLMARQKNGRGEAIARSPEALAAQIIKTLHTTSAEAILRVTLRADGLPDDPQHPLIQAGLAQRTGATKLSVNLAHPLIGLGASAATYYPNVAKLLGTPAEIPEHAGVANAIGAVAGRVSIRREIHVSAHENGFTIHAETPIVATNLEDATEQAKAAATKAARTAALEAGAGDPEITTQFTAKTVEIEGRRVFVEGTAEAEATGRPRLAEASV